ncbi:MAG: substrate-binding domain-containing protein [Magnetococcales bacterium]|nr:substrate-binding domain-containing protein [Magnetococcales bacterium]
MLVKSKGSGSDRPSSLSAVRPFFRFGLALLVLMGGGASQGGSEELRGPAFYPPEENTLLVSAEWVAQTIQHPKEAGDLDLLVTLDQHFYAPGEILIRRFAKQEGLSVNVQKGTCGTTAGMLAGKQADIGSFCCPPASSDRLPGLEFHTVGIVANALIVHPDNPIVNVTRSEAEAIFTGEIKKWNQLSDPGVRSLTHNIHPTTRLHCKIRPGHWRTLLDNEDYFSPLIHNTSTMLDMMDVVAADPLAIGWVARWVMEEPGNLGKVRALSLDGVQPDDIAALSQGRYPYYKVLNLTSWKGAPDNPKADRLIDYLLENTHRIDVKNHIADHKRLREGGWRFSGDEVIGEPVP